MVRAGQVILALSNPDAEIKPQQAMEAGASFAADGKSINNALAFPGIFRGALDAQALRINKGHVSELNHYLPTVSRILMFCRTTSTEWDTCF